MALGATGTAHIGVPTNDMEATKTFYQALGFDIILETLNEDAMEKVCFLSLGNLTIETYENGQAAMKPGAVDHIAINVEDIDAAYKFINEAGLNNTKDLINFLPFWEEGTKFFTIEGPNKEKIEFSQIL